MSAIEIRQHTPGEDVSDFLKAAHVVFEGDPNWIPPLNIMLKDQLSPKSPFFQHADVTLFSARKNGKLVGRASAQVDREHLKRYNDATGFFGFFDTINDEEVARALMERAKAWLKSKGMKRVRGPMSLGVNQELGTLVEGFDTPPMVMMPHSRSYQGALIEATGLQKVKDLYAWRWEVGPEMPRRCMAAHREMLDMGFKFRPTDLWKEMDELVAIFDNAWQHNWGYVPMTRAEADQLRNELRLILDPEIAIVATLNGELVAMGIATPNLHEAIGDFGGKITPMNIAKLLWRMKVARPKSARLAFLGVKEHIRKQKKYMPIALALINELNRRGYQRGYQWGELSWTLEDNGPVNALIKSAGGKIYKRYRLYEGDISPT
jgi:hypothetical protein